MFNYAKKVTIKETATRQIKLFMDTIMIKAEESEAFKAEKAELAEKLEKAINDKNADSAQALTSSIQSITDKWTARRKELDFILFGGKNDKGEKVAGACSFVSDSLYKAYVEYVTDGNNGAFALAIKLFCRSLLDGDITESVEKHFYSDILLSVSSKKFNSDRQLLQGATYLTTINKRAWKKMFVGALADVINNNHTLRVKPAKKQEATK